jgi:hypothetical protein
MLGAYFRIICFNNSGTSSGATNATTTAKLKGWYISSSGVPTWGTETTIFSNTGAITTGSYDTADATAQNNSGATNPLIGAEIELKYVSTGTPTGPVTFYLQNSDDSGTTWPDNGNGEVLWQFAPSGAATFTTVVKYPG